MSTQVSRIMLVDDHPLVRAGLRSLFNDVPDLSVCAEVGNITDALEVARIEDPDLAVIDISLDDGSGLDLIKRMKVHAPRVKMLVCSMHDESLFAERAINAGAQGFVNKHQVTEQIIEAVHQVLSGRIYLSERMVERVIDGFAKRKEIGSSSIEDLSDRELEVFGLIGQGLSTSKIAERLHLSVKTVETHREKIKRKLQLASGGELVRHAVQWHIEQA
jgi:DNA-binding NarL/FixJ family response regulator